MYRGVSERPRQRFRIQGIPAPRFACVKIVLLLSKEFEVAVIPKGQMCARASCHRVARKLVGQSGPFSLLFPRDAGYRAWLCEPCARAAQKVGGLLIRNESAYDRRVALWG